MHAVLARWEHDCTPELVRVLMWELGLVPCQLRRSRKGTTRQASHRQASKQAQIPDLVNRDFTGGAPGEKLVADMTYVRTGEGRLYPAHVSIATQGKSLAGPWTTIARHR